MKQCRDCRKYQALSDFVKSKVFKDGIDTLCKVCNRKRVKTWRKNNPEKRKIQAKIESASDKIYNQRRYLKASYGMTVEQWNEMFEAQEGCCAICGVHQSSLKKRLSVDHCHVTGMIRKLLCPQCNYLIGNAKENIAILKEAINYLTEYQIGY